MTNGGSLTWESLGAQASLLGEVQKADALEKTLTLGKTEGRRRRG